MQLNSSTPAMWYYMHILHGPSGYTVQHSSKNSVELIDL